MDPGKLTQTTPEVLASALETCVLSNVEAFTWGSPGTGKSDIIRQLAAHMDAHLLDIRASQWDAVDTRGIPYLSKTNTTRWAIPEVFPSEEYAAKFKRVIIFLDELNSAPPSVQAALYQLILDHRLGDYVMPKNCHILAAGNLETDRAVTHRMSQALADRFLHFQLLVDPRAWDKWALDHNLHLAPISYVRWKPDHLHLFDPKSVSKAQPTPRGWEKVSKVLYTIEKTGVNGQVEAALMTGKLGEAVGTAFCGFLKIYRDLPDPDGVILAPDSAPVFPANQTDVQHALCGAVSDRATRGNIDNVIKYAERLNSEFMVYLVQSAAVLHPEIQQTRGFIKWASDHPEVLIG